MNLQQTVSKILGRGVSIDEAIQFAKEHYGTLCQYNRELDQKIKGYTEYQFFIFSDIFMAEIEDLDVDSACDLVYPVIVNELKQFLDSDFNVDTQSEYDCMQDYLTANIDRISLTLADHVNI